MTTTFVVANLKLSNFEKTLKLYTKLIQQKPFQL
jgi:hypothetical protein